MEGKHLEGNENACQSCDPWDGPLFGASEDIDLLTSTKRPLEPKIHRTTAAFVLSVPLLTLLTIIVRVGIGEGGEGVSSDKVRSQIQGNTIYPARKISTRTKYTSSPAVSEYE